MGLCCLLDGSRHISFDSATTHPCTRANSSTLLICVSFLFSIPFFVLTGRVTITNGTQRLGCVCTSHGLATRTRHGTTNLHYGRDELCIWRDYKEAHALSAQRSRSLVLQSLRPAPKGRRLSSPLPVRKA